MKPFKSYELFDLISKRSEKITNYVKSLSNEMIMSGQDETIVHNLFEKYKFLPVKIGHELIDRIEIKERKIKSYNRFYQRGDSFGEQEFTYMMEYK